MAWLTADDVHWFHEGTHLHAYGKLGAHATNEGTHFAVWAPNARTVSVVGDWNGWSNSAHPLERASSLGLWHAFVPGVDHGALYKFHLDGPNGAFDKTDPYARAYEDPPRTASIVWRSTHQWRDGEWMKRRASERAHEKPVSIYEVHLGSWMRVPEEHNRRMGYHELGERLALHVTRAGFTHIELLPIMEHPFYGSWGYQTLGYFAPSRRYGTPDDFKAFVDTLHAHGIGVILDWVPSHFPTDAYGLAKFDGTHLYEHADPRQGFHPDWNSAIFNYGRNEVQSFLLSSAMFWCDELHVDGLRVDAVASMLYLDYSRKAGEWIPNAYGGRENLSAIALLSRLNRELYARFPGVQTFAEESTAWPRVSRPVDEGGLGFGFKWDMGWMHDTLKFFARDPVHRRHHLNELTFRQLYAFSENFVLSLSHDEVVHGKGSLAGKMPGSDPDKLASLRLLYGYMWAQPGKKLLFMGSEFAQWREWAHEQSLDWHLLESPAHRGVLDWVRDLNALYRQEPAMHAWDCDARGFQWIECNDADNTVLSFVRYGPDTSPIVCALNCTPVLRRGYKVGLPKAGVWREVLNSDAAVYGGKGEGNLGRVHADGPPLHGQPTSVALTLPAFGAVFLAAGAKGHA